MLTFKNMLCFNESFKDTEDMRAVFLRRWSLTYSCLSWEKGPRNFLMPIINSFIKEVHSVKGPRIVRIVYQRCLDVAMSWIGPGSAALITLEWLVLVKVSVRSDQCLCWGLWLCNGAYPDILHSLCLTHTHTNIIFQSPAGKSQLKAWAICEDRNHLGLQMEIYYTCKYFVSSSRRAQQLAFVSCSSGVLWCDALFTISG